MGADWLQLFDKKFCDEIVCLNANTISDFVERHLHLFEEFSLFRYDFDGVPVEDRIQRLLDGGETEASLKNDLVDELCFSEQKIILDYWGCYAEGFSSADPEGAIADYKLFPGRKEQSFHLLLPNHVDRILESLHAHRNELTIMAEAELNRVREWREICAADSSKMVAYVFDV
jgi:hypothetical protein